MNQNEQREQTRTYYTAEEKSIRDLLAPSFDGLRKYEQERQTQSILLAAQEEERKRLSDEGWQRLRKAIEELEEEGEPRVYETGASRGSEEGKYDYEAFFSPLVLEFRAEYMHLHRHREDGTLRDGDNWQKGIPKGDYMKSGWRHFFAWWKLHRKEDPTPADKDRLAEAIVALMFNCEGYLHEYLRERQA